MSRPQRLGVILAAVVVAVVAFLVFRPEDDDDPASPAVQTTTAPSTDTAPTETDTATPPPAPKPEVQTVQVRGAKPVGGVQKIRANKGDSVRFVVTSDVADEAHLHGYDISRPVAAGRPARFRFMANIEGVFELELEERAVPIASLEIQP